VNLTVKHWIKHEESRRLLNGFYILLALLLIGIAAVVSIGALIPLVFVALAAGLSNVLMILARPNLEASDEEIRLASIVGPNWFARLVSRFDSKP
jgi:hypothetical protein